MTKPKHATVAMSPVKNSKRVFACGHCCDSKTLSVQFKEGGPTYHYHDVSADEHAKLLAAESLGSHLHTHFIKPGRKFTKISD